MEQGFRFPFASFSATFSPVMTIPPSAPEQTAAVLANLYAPLTMPPGLLAAHRANDRAVMAAYGFDLKMAESDCVAELFKLYEALSAGGRQ